MMKRFISFVLLLTLVCNVCFAESAEETTRMFNGINDPELLPYIEDELYADAVAMLNSDEYFVENVEAIYISQEYLDELAFNSQANVFFGYTAEELNTLFEGQRYAFTLGENYETTVVPYVVTREYDDTFEQIVRNLAIGGGVILVSVTIGIVAAPLAPAVSAILIYGAKTGVEVAVSGAKFGFLLSGAIAFVQTGDIEYALKKGMLGGSEGFKYGAIIGTVAGGVEEGVGLFTARMNGLTMNEAATIQMESQLPLDFIKNFHSMKEYEIYKEAGLTFERLGGSYAYTRPIDLNSVITDKYGHTMTNAERILSGRSPVDPSGIPYELHHIGQMPNSPLAVLTKAEHMQGGHNTILHFREDSLVEHGAEWSKQVSDYWIKYLAKYGGGL